MGDAFDIYDWPNSVLGKKLAKLEETLQCPICSEIYLNPHTLTCGHTYCSHCIRKHFDKAFNPSNTSDQCPVCKDKSEVYHLKPNRNLDAVVLAFKDVRPSLLNEISVDLLDNYSGRSSIGISGKRGRDKSPLIVQRLSHKSFHGKSKKYVKDTIETLCNISKVIPCLDGDQDELERYYRELIHLNNAQIGSSEPLSFDDVVKEINRSQSFKRKEAKKNSFAKAQAEKMIKGELSIGIQKNFSLLAQQVRDNMMKQKTIQSISRSSSSSSSGSSSSGSSSRSSSSSSSSSGSIEASKTHEISDEAELGEYSDGKWRILMSNKLGRPFFYNSETKIGQFSIPEEFTTTSAQEEEEHTSLVELQDDPESVPTAAKVFDLSTSDSPKNTNDVEFQAVYSKKAKIEKSTSSSIPQEDSQNRKEDSQDPINTSGQQSREKNSRAIIDSDRSNDQQGCVESEEIMCIPEDSCSENFENIMPVCEKTEEEIPFDHTQIDSQIGFYESNLSTTVLNGGGDDDGDGDGDVLNEKKWACTACTFENNNEVFSCAMCGHPSGLSKLRRSQRDSHVNTGSGSIMHGFSLSQNHGLGSTQTQQTQSSTDLGIFPTPRGNTNNLSNRRLSSTTSIISHGSSSKSQQNNRKKR